MNDIATPPLPPPSVVSDTTEPLPAAAQARLLAAMYRKLRRGNKRPPTKGAFGRSHFWDRNRNEVKAEDIPVTPPTETIAPSP